MRVVPLAGVIAGWCALAVGAWLLGTAIWGDYLHLPRELRSAAQWSRATLGGSTMLTGLGLLLLSYLLDAVQELLAIAGAERQARQDRDFAARK